MHSRFVVLTGGPGAGKTAVLEVVRRQFEEAILVLPEAASIVFGGGFPRSANVCARKAAQRAIFCVQRELEAYASDASQDRVVLCDRGTIDGMAYWPGEAEELLREMGTTREAEFARYALVVHLEPPSADAGYNHDNPLRIESPEEAQAIDMRIGEAWAGHPRLLRVRNQRRFTDKLDDVLEIVRRDVLTMRGVS